MTAKSTVWMAASLALLVLGGGLLLTLAHKASGDSEVSDLFNALMDGALEAGYRIVELPLVVLLGGVALVSFAGALAVALVSRRGGRVRIAWVALAVLASVSLFALAWIADRRAEGLLDEIRRLRAQSVEASAGRVVAKPAEPVTSGSPVAIPTAVPALPTVREAFLFDRARANDELAKMFTAFDMQPAVNGPAVDFVRLSVPEPVACAFLAVVDLRHPGVEICLGTDVERKSLTSDFARENDCVVAVNGEAGVSTGPTCGLGPWTGNLIYRGKVILLEDSDKRPFLSFDRDNHATYSPAAVVDREASPEKYNVIWGRGDILLKGELQPPRRAWDKRPARGSRYPRTAMAVNAGGTLLYLLVVDGRQPGYSMGFSLAELGGVLKAFGATDGMWCDQGGSSCMYLKSVGGIADVPCGGHGRERQTYTHFGVSVRTAGAKE